MKKVVLSLFVILAGGLAQAHEFWMEPQKFFFNVGEKAVIRFRVGENFEGEPWNLKKNRVEKLEINHLSVKTDLRTVVKEGEKNNLELQLKTEGTHLVVMQSNNAFIELEGEKFNAYLKEDGLDYILDERTKSGTLDKPSKEFYSRHVKLLLQAGSKTDDTYKKRAGLPYEIIPMQNPYALKAGDYLECQVMLNGRVAPHALVKVWNRIEGTTFLQNIYTENDGTIKFPISAAGTWMVSSVAMMKSPTQGADYQSLWASLVFAVK